ncbi:MAG TPA: BTAD domain-containing putative transcriptional regulator [Polyangiaceae bacterium]|nr:BTAD domain-containing putative transcriptional regulator [Polyangiaceae bacterium]
MWPSPVLCSLAAWICGSRSSLGSFSRGESFGRADHSRRKNERAALESALELYQGELLEGFSPRAQAFDEWLHGERRRVRDRALATLERLAQLQEQQGDLPAALASALRLVAMDPLRESGHRSLMRVYAESGRTSEALRQFKTLRELLRSELDAAPDRETVALAQRLQAGAERRAERPGVEARAVSGADATELGASAGAAELRQVCALAVLVPEHAAGGFGARVARVLEPFGVSPVRDSSDVWLGVFGAVRATGSESERAVRAGIALARELEGALRAGIASGAVWQERAESAAVRGDVLRQAVELAERASQGLVVSAALARALGPRLRLAPALPEAERGSERQVLAWVEAPEALRGTPFVGRRYELAQLTLALELAAASRRGRAFIVRGEAGIGKTRLVAELPARAAALGFRVHVHSIVDFGRSEQPVSALVRELLGGEDGDALSVLSRAVADGLLPSDDLPPLLDALQALPSGVRELEPASRDEHLRRRREALVRLLEAQATREPRLLWIDDIHWADPGTLTQVAAWMALSGRAPLVVIVTTRIDGQPDQPEFWSALRGCAVTTLDLAPFSEEEARALVRELDAERALEQQVELALQRAGGNPLFLEQLLRSGQLDAVPDTVQSLVQSRMDRLEPSARGLLAAAAVLGQRFQLQALADLLGRPHPELAPLLAQALLVQDAEGPRFVHELVREGIYAGLTEQRRVELHRRAASHYAGRDPSLRARHLDRAGAREAPRAYLEAATAERRNGNLELCDQLCARGLELSTLAADRFGLAQQRGEVSCALGRLDPALAWFEQARTSAPDAVSEARTWIGTAAALRVLDRSQEALGALERAERRIDPSSHPALMSSIHYLRGSVVFPLGDPAACLRWHTRALEAAQAAQSLLAEAHALSGIADAHYISGRFATARTWFARCERSARAAGALELELTSQGMLAIIELVGGRLRAARAGCQATAERCRAAGALRGEAVMWTAVAWGSLLLGEWTAALRDASRAVELAARIGARRFEALALSYLVLARLELEAAPDVGRELARALELARASSIGFSGGAAYAAWISAERDPERLRRVFEEAERVLASSSMNVALVLFAYRDMIASLRISDVQRVRRLADLLESSCRQEPHELGSLLVSFGRQLGAWLSGQRGAELQAELGTLRARLVAHELAPALEAFDAALAPAAPERPDT